jgi:phospholipase/carboxylesterase
MIALHVGLRRKQRVAAIVGYSGMLTGGLDCISCFSSAPPVLLVHGSHDAIVPVAALHTAEAELKRLEVQVTTHVSNGIEHTVDPVGLRLGCEFVRAGFGL